MAIAHYFPVRYLLAENKWRLWEIEGIFLKVLGIRRTQKGGQGWGKWKGERFTAVASLKMSDAGVCLSPEVGSISEGQMTCVRQRNGAESQTPPSGCRKIPKTLWCATVAWYSGRHQEVAEGNSCLSPTVS